jgi:hypothetical protein
MFLTESPEALCHPGFCWGLTKARGDANKALRQIALGNGILKIGQTIGVGTSVVQRVLQTVTPA